MSHLAGAESLAASSGKSLYTGLVYDSISNWFQNFYTGPTLVWLWSPVELSPTVTGYAGDMPPLIFLDFTNGPFKYLKTLKGGEKKNLFLEQNRRLWRLIFWPWKLLYSRIHFCCHYCRAPLFKMGAHGLCLFFIAGLKWINVACRNRCLHSNCSLPI